MMPVEDVSNDDMYWNMRFTIHALNPTAHEAWHERNIRGMFVQRLREEGRETDYHTLDNEFDEFEETLLEEVMQENQVRENGLQWWVNRLIYNEPPPRPGSKYQLLFEKYPHIREAKVEWGDGGGGGRAIVNEYHIRFTKNPKLILDKINTLLAFWNYREVRSDRTNKLGFIMDLSLEPETTTNNGLSYTRARRF